MIIKQHLSGVAIAYPPMKRTGAGKGVGRYQGSLYSQQKRSIADATEYMRRYGKHKPLIFVLTAPGFTDLADEKPLVSKFVNNMRMRHGLGHYVWVRELTGNGYPHFHFVATMPRFDAVKMSLLWSSYFGSTAKNSIRLGTKPVPGKKRKYYVNSPAMASYLSKYIGKNLGTAVSDVKTKIKAFQISHELRSLSSPAVYEEAITETIQGYHERVWNIQKIPDWIETEGLINTKGYRWKKVSELFPVFIGIKKRYQMQT